MKRLSPLLSVIAGMVDLTGFLTLGNLFTAHATGNLVLMAATLVRSEPVRLTQVLIVPVFMFAIGASWCLARHARRRHASPLRLLLWCQFLLLMCLLVFAAVTKPSSTPHGLAAGCAAMLAATAMGCQFALLRVTLPDSPSTAVMTGNLADAVLALLDVMTQPRPLDGHATNRLKRSTAVLGGFIGGCMIAGIAVRFLDDGAWLLPMALAGAALIASSEMHGAAFRHRRSMETKDTDPVN